MRWRETIWIVIFAAAAAVSAQQAGGVAGANAEAKAPAAAEIPAVLLTPTQRSWCKVRVGDPFPKLPQLAGGQLPRGEDATVILFWAPDRWMSRAALTDLQRDVGSVRDSKKTAVAAIAVGAAPAQVPSSLPPGVTLPLLGDPQGAAFAAVGTQSLPRIYVLDDQGKIVWFDIEYGEATRRELALTLAQLSPQSP